MKSDIEIIKDCLNGNQNAFKQLYERYVNYCYGICIRYAVPNSEIKDIVQIIFTQVFQSLKSYDVSKAKFKTWFTHVCIHHILSYKKKQFKHSQMQTLEDYKSVEHHYFGNDIEENIDKQHILALLAKMPQNYRLVFNLFIIDGFTHDEIAKQLNISSASSRVILNRARAWVKKTLVNHLNS